MNILDFAEIESLLSKGQNSTVYKAWHTRLEKHVTIKEQKYSDKTELEINRNEVESLKNIKSNYLPIVYDFLVCEDKSYTILEFINGLSMDKLIQKGRKFTVSQITKWYRQLAVALKVIHEKNIYHRDIKPGNIILTSGGKNPAKIMGSGFLESSDICLIDFNAAYVKGCEHRQCSRSIGYASPEQLKIFKAYQTASIRHLRGDETQLLERDCRTELLRENKEHTTINQIDWARSDIYSLGATMLHLLTGTRQPNPSKYAKRVRPDTMLSKIIEKSMRTNPEKRFSGAKQLYNALCDIEKSGNKSAQQKTVMTILESR